VGGKIRFRFALREIFFGKGPHNLGPVVASWLKAFSFRNDLDDPPQGYWDGSSLCTPDPCYGGHEFSHLLKQV
jgi:hypothetical protein